MRMDKGQNLDAKYIVNNYEEEELAKIFFEYGEEKYAKSIADKICKYRAKKEITKTLELSDIIGNFDSIKRIFQALRIETNNELKPLYNTIKDAIDCLETNRKNSSNNISFIRRQNCKTSIYGFFAENVYVQKIYHIVYVTINH